MVKRTYRIGTHDWDAWLWMRGLSRVHAQSTVLEADAARVHQCDLSLGNLIVHLQTQRVIIIIYWFISGM